MGKGDIRTRRGKIWRRTYGVSRPRRYKTVVRPHAATTRKVKTLKDLPKAVAEPIVKKPIVEAVKPQMVETTKHITEVTIPVIEQVQPVVAGITAEVPQIVAESVVEASVAEIKEKSARKSTTKKPASKKAPAAKKPVAKKAPAKKKK